MYLMFDTSQGISKVIKDLSSLLILTVKNNPCNCPYEKLCTDSTSFRETCITI